MSKRYNGLLIVHAVTLWYFVRTKKTDTKFELDLQNSKGLTQKTQIAPLMQHYYDSNAPFMDHRHNNIMNT